MEQGQSCTSSDRCSFCHRSGQLVHSIGYSMHPPLAQPQLHACAACIHSFHSHRRGWHSRRSMEHSCSHRTSGRSCHKHRTWGHSSCCSKLLAQHRHHACRACNCCTHRTCIHTMGNHNHGHS